MRHTLQLLRSYRWQLIVGPIFKLAEAVFELLLPLMMRRLINQGVEMGNTQVIWQMGGWMLLLSVLGLGSAWVCQYVGSVAAQSYGTGLRNQLFQKIQTLSQSNIDQIGVASLTNRITNDTNTVQNGVAMLIRLVVRAPFVCIGSIVAIVYLDAKLAPIILIATPLFVFVLWLIMRKTVPMFRKVQQKLDLLVRVLRENLRGVRVIRAFARQSQEEERFDEASNEHFAISRRVGRLAGLANPATMFIMNMAIVILIWFGGIQVNVGSIQVGTLVALVNYVTDLSLTLLILADLVVLYTRVFASARRVDEIFEMQNEIIDGDKPMVLNHAHEAQQQPLVSYKNVGFRFVDGAENAIENITFSVYEGETIGIIGGTGSGKSTLLNLMTRLYDVTEGSIEIGENDIRDYRLDDLREAISVVPQKSVLISGTVESNLRWGYEKATEEEMQQALATAQADFILEKGGLQARVERGGTNFSGGQRQRLSIARALVRKSPILIMDDSTSALDFMTDKALRKAIQKDEQNATVFIVSQRVSSIMEADKILVLDDGRLVSSGAHDELVKSCEVYREIVELQLEEAGAL